MKLTSTMTIRDAVLALSKGNPGALSVLAQVCQKSPESLYYLDAKGIYGSDIWSLYKDNDQNIDKLITALAKEELHARP